MDGKLLVAGLGNPGLRYAGTRHNIGFLIVDAVHSAAGGASWKKGFSGMYCTVEVAGRPCLLLKPTTYMNLSGTSLKEAVLYYNIEADSIVVVHDDVDFQLGTLRVKKGGGAAGHKGVDSCIKELGTPDFIRLRVGVGRPVDTYEEVTEYVLSKFAKSEEDIVSKMVAAGAKAVESISVHGYAAAMNELNKRPNDIVES